MRKLYLVLVLPFLMLLAQQGLLRHELGHLAEASALAHEKGAPKHHTGDVLCDICLSFAHMAASARPHAPVLWLQTQLRHHLVSAVWAHATEARGLVPRSRGPPTFS